MQRPRLTPPVRFWMTGAIAVVMASLGGRADASTDRQSPARASRFGVALTARLLEDTARSRGLGVFARIRQTENGVLVLVLESSQGGTPVVMQGEGDAMRSVLPLALEVRPDGQGARVLLPAPVDILLPNAPLGLMADLEGLPTLVDAALV